MIELAVWAGAVVAYCAVDTKVVDVTSCSVIVAGVAL